MGAASSHVEERVEGRPYVAAVVVAGGEGKRMGGTVPKPYLELGGRPVLVHSLQAFEQAPGVREVILVTREEDLALARQQVVERYGLAKVTRVVAGGRERQDSVYRGLQALGEAVEVVAIHDGARPLVTVEIIERALEEVCRHPAVVVSVPVRDTIKETCGGEGEGPWVAGTLERRRLWAVQTPQVFRRDLVERAYREAMDRGFYGTDDATLVERLGVRVKVVPGSEENLKITTPCDLAVAEALLCARQGAGGGPGPGLAWRVGFGYDVHRLVTGRVLVLGGVEVPSDRGLAGHSDADVVAHAVMDALLGAAGERDIGVQFPDTDPDYRGADSMVLLSRVVKLVREKGYRVVNVDCTVLAEEPHLAPYIPRMVSRLERAMGLGPGRVAVKATTGEGLGFIGRGEGIAAWAVVALAAGC